MKKTLLILTALVTIIVFCVGLTVTTSAVTFSGTCGENVTWNLNTTTGELVISGSGAMENYTDMSDVPWLLYSVIVNKVTIQNGVTSIGVYAFSGCTSLTSINVDENNTTYKSIDGNLYTKDEKTLILYAVGKNDTHFTIPNSVTSIGDEAFYYYTRLTSVTIGGSVTSIDDSLFRHCTILTSINVDENNTTYKSIYGNLYTKDEKTLIRYAGGKTDTHFTIPNSVTSIGDYAFNECEHLASVTIPDRVTSIGEYAFDCCTSLTNVTIPARVTSIGSYAFGGCDSFTSVTIPDSVTSIGGCAFCDCDSLTSVTISDSVTSIGNNAFFDCRNITTATIPTTAISYIPKDKLQTVIITSGDSIGHDAFYNCQSLTSITIPASVTSIGDNAFSGCSSLKNVYISDIAKWCEIAFRNSSSNPLSYAENLYLNGVLVTSLVIPDGVTSISNYAFGGCSSLTSVNIPDSVTSIGSEAFRSCTSLTNVTIPDRVKSIGFGTFGYCRSITSVTIPDSVTSIDNVAFYGCTSLEKIIYCGTEEQWNAITKLADWDTNTGAYEVEYHEHTWNSGEVTTPATHLTTGVKTFTCTDCGETKTETVDKTTAHTYGAWQKHDAKQHKKICECNDTVYADHVWNSGVITTPATHSATGIKTFTCTDCGETKAETVEKTTAHTYGAWQKHNAAQHKKTCECNDTVYADHVWNSGVITTPATHSATGVKTFTCTDCGETKTEVIEKLPEEPPKEPETTKPAEPAETNKAPESTETNKAPESTETNKAPETTKPVETTGTTETTKGSETSATSDNTTDGGCNSNLGAGFGVIAVVMGIAVLAVSKKKRI